MSQLDDKINEHFPGLVVRKDLVKAVKGNAIVPSYVLEYLLGQYCATNDPDSIESGIETVKEILAKHYVHRNQANLVKSNIREKGRYKVIDRISVNLNDKNDTYEATFANLDIKKVLVDTDTITRHPKLLVTGVWCIADVEYEPSEDRNVVPWILSSIKPIQLSQFDFDAYLGARQAFTTDEWIDLLMQSIGFNPDLFGKRSKLLQLLRLVPFVERNYNLIELGPKGTGKSHIFSEFSPHGMLVSGGEVTVPKLFVNNNSGKIGLVGYWDVVAFDEFAGKQKRVDKALVDILKNYLANKSFSRGVETLGAEASMAFIGNTKHNVPYMLKHSDFFEELPDKYYDSAFIDRLHAFLPGWEVDIIRGEMFSSGFGFVVDYIAEILRHLRNQDYSDRYNPLFSLSEDIATRDRDAINKTFSGLMKVLFPNGEQTTKEIKEILSFSIECRKRVKDQLLRMDHTFNEVDFSFLDADGNKFKVTTLEEVEYPAFYKRGHSSEASSQTGTIEETDPSDPATVSHTDNQEAPTNNAGPTEDHITVSENQRGISFDDLFGKFFINATELKITDPYIRLFHQVRNLMELLETLIRFKPSDTEVKVHLVTSKEEMRFEQQDQYLQSIQDNVSANGINFTWEYKDPQTIHARHIHLNNGWKILLDRGLDIFQRFEMNDAFSLSNRMQEARACKAFEVTFVRV